MVGDDELYSAFLAGNTDKYDALMIRYGDNLTFYLFGYLHDWHDAEDLMIEAFARIMVKRPRIGEGNFKAYLYKTARNLASRFNSHKKRYSVYSFDDINEEPYSAELTEKIIQDEEKRRILHLCLDRIEPELREVLWLVYFEDMSYDEAAQVLSVNRKRVDNLLQRGKAHLRVELAKEGLAAAFD